MRVRTVARLHLSDLKRRVAPATLRQRRYDLESFISFTGGDVAARAVKQKHVQAWVDDQTCAASTLKLRFLSVRMMFKYAQEHRWINRLPTDGITLPRVPRRQRRALSLDQLRALGAVLPDERARLIIALGVNEGLRRVEIARLELGDIDFKDMLVRVVTAKSGGNEDVIPLTEDTAEKYLRPYMTVRGTKPGVLIQSYTTGRALSPDSIGKLVTSWMLDAGIKETAFDGISLHACRHTTADHLRAAGAQPEDIQHALRHANLSSTWTYLRPERNLERLRLFMGRHLEAS